MKIKRINSNYWSVSRMAIPPEHHGTSAVLSWRPCQNIQTSNCRANPDTASLKKTTIIISKSLLSPPLSKKRSVKQTWDHHHHHRKHTLSDNPRERSPVRFRLIMLNADEHINTTFIYFLPKSAGISPQLGVSHVRIGLVISWV